MINIQDKACGQCQASAKGAVIVVEKDGKIGEATPLCEDCLERIKTHLNNGDGKSLEFVNIRWRE